MNSKVAALMASRGGAVGKLWESVWLFWAEVSLALLELRKVPRLALLSWGLLRWGGLWSGELCLALHTKGELWWELWDMQKSFETLWALGAVGSVLV